MTVSTTLSAKRVAAFSAAAAILLTGAAATLPATNAFAATTTATHYAVTGDAVNATNNTHWAMPGEIVKSTVNYTNFEAGKRYAVVSKFVDESGKVVGNLFGAQFNVLAAGSGSFAMYLETPNLPQGQKLRVVDEIYPLGTVIGDPSHPSSIAPGTTPVVSSGLTNDAKIINVGIGDVDLSIKTPTIYNSVTTNTTDASHTQTVGGKVTSRVQYTGLPSGGSAYAMTRLVDAVTGEAVTDYAATPFTGWSVSVGFGSFDVDFTIPASASGKTLVAQTSLFSDIPYTGTAAAPGAIKPGLTPIATAASLTDANNQIVVPKFVSTTPIAASAPTAPIGSQPTTAPGTAPATTTISTTAVDTADNDKVVNSGGTITDTLTYKGLIPGAVYVLHTTLWNKTDNWATDVSKARVFVPTTADGTVKVEVPVPVGYEGKELTVFQTLYNGTDVLVGKHLDKIQIAANKTYIIAERNPNNPNQTVKVFNATKPCKVSGYLWKDANKNGVMDANEEPVAGVTTDLRKFVAGTVGSLLQRTTTNAQGYYEFTVPQGDCGPLFTDFNEGQYPAGWTGFGGGDSDLVPTNLGSGWTTSYTLKPGDDLKRVDGGLRQRDGAVVAGSFCTPRIQGTVNLLSADRKTVVATTTVDANGNWSFNDVKPASYVVQYQRVASVAGIYVNTGDFTEASSWGAGGRTWGAQAFTAPFDVTGTGNYTKFGCGTWLSPLALDLNGNGKVDTSNLSAQPASAAFDLLGTGSPVASGWLAQGDGFLVAPNADGTVTSINNLFGGSIGEGFAQLAAYDTNHDGVINGAELASIKVWVDANGDHKAEANEISSLVAHGIVSLNVAYTNTPVADNGNVVIEHGAATKANGSSVVIGDAYFATGALNGVNTGAAAKVAADSAATVAGLPVAEQNAIAAAFVTAAK